MALKRSASRVASEWEIVMEEVEEEWAPGQLLGCSRPDAIVAVVDERGGEEGSGRCSERRGGAGWICTARKTGELVGGACCEQFSRGATALLSVLLACGSTACSTCGVHTTYMPRYAHG